MNVRSRKIVRDLMGNRARTLLVVLAIAIGLTGLSTTLRARAIFTDSITEELATINPSSATLVTAGSTTDQVSDVALLDDVAQAEGIRVTFGRIAAGENKKPLRLAIVDDLDGRSIDRLRPDTGQWPPPTGTIALERSTIQLAGLAVGDIATITDPLGQTHELLVAATTYDLTIVSGQLVGQMVFGYASTATWDQLGLPTAFNEVVFTTTTDRSDEAHIAAVAEQAASVLDDRGSPVQSIRIPPPDKHVLDNVVASLLLILGSLGILSLVLSGFLVFNTVAALLARQIPQIGAMKAVGASRRDVLTIYLATVAVYSLFALVIAIPSGAVLAALLSQQLGTLLNIDVATFGAPLWVCLSKLPVACSCQQPPHWVRSWQAHARPSPKQFAAVTEPTILAPGQSIVSLHDCGACLPRSDMRRETLSGASCVWRSPSSHWPWEAQSWSLFCRYGVRCLQRSTRLLTIGSKTSLLICKKRCRSTTFDPSW